MLPYIRRRREAVAAQQAAEETRREAALAAAREAAEREARRVQSLRQAMVICFRCGLLRGQTPYGRQTCRCEPKSGDEFGGDVNEWFQLCVVCVAGTAGGTPRFAWLGCSRCVDLERRLRQTTGRVVLPLGRHSLMNGAGIPGRLAVTSPGAVEAFAHQLTGLTRGWKALDEWRVNQIARIASAAGLADRNEATLASWFALGQASPQRSRESYERFLGSPLPLDEDG